MNNLNSSETHDFYGPSDQSSPEKSVISSNGHSDTAYQKDTACKVIPLYPGYAETSASESFEVASIYKSGRPVTKTLKKRPYTQAISWSLILGGVICLAAGWVIKDTIAELFKVSSIVLMLLGIQYSQFSDKT